MKLRRRLRFECEPSSYEGIGHLSALHPWTSSSAYGREIDADGRDIESYWQEPDDGCEWLTLVGAADEQAKSRLEARSVDSEIDPGRCGDATPKRLVRA